MQTISEGSAPDSNTDKKSGSGWYEMIGSGIIEVPPFWILMFISFHFIGYCRRKQESFIITKESNC